MLPYICHKIRYGSIFKCKVRNIFWRRTQLHCLVWMFFLILGRIVIGCEAVISPCLRRRTILSHSRKTHYQHITSKDVFVTMLTLALQKTVKITLCELPNITTDYYMYIVFNTLVYPVIWRGSLVCCNYNSVCSSVIVCLFICFCFCLSSFLFVRYSVCLFVCLFVCYYILGCCCCCCCCCCCSVDNLPVGLQKHCFLILHSIYKRSRHICMPCPNLKGKCMSHWWTYNYMGCVPASLPAFLTNSLAVDWLVVYFYFVCFHFYILTYYFMFFLCRFTDFGKNMASHLSNSIMTSMCTRNNGPITWPVSTYWNTVIIGTLVKTLPWIIHLAAPIIQVCIHDIDFIIWDGRNSQI